MIALPGEAIKEWYSFAVFLRPDDETPVKAVSSPLIAEAEEEKQGQDVFTSG